MKETESRRLGDMIHKDLKSISNQSQKENSRSDLRRAVEDLFEAQRYQKMHEDLYDF